MILASIKKELKLSIHSGRHKSHVNVIPGHVVAPSWHAVLTCLAHTGEGL